MVFKLKRTLIKKLPLEAQEFLRIFIKNPSLLYPRQLLSLYKLRRLIASGQVAIVPVGFRCWTKIRLYRKLGISQASLPFDNGFFPPDAVAQVLGAQHISLDFNDRLPQTVCIKNESFTDINTDYGIKFEKSTYDKINHLAKSKEQEDINRYLDSTFAYYTLNTKYGYVLAHYNWHEFANVKHSKNHTEPEHNIKEINMILSRRIERMLKMCEKAKIIFFVYEETQGYNYMAIDEKYSDLKSIEPIKAAVKDRFNSKSIVIESADIRSPHDIMKIIKKR